MKKLLVHALVFCLSLAPAYADSSFVAPTATGQAVTGQIPGTATNDSATAGNVGEYRSASTADTGLNQTSSTITVTIASPAVITWGTTIPFAFNGTGAAVVNFTTTGALPTGIVAGTNYYAFNVVGNTFNIATSADNAIAGTAINTTGSQSGTQTGVPTAILVSGSNSIIAAMSLSAGDWEVTGDLAFFGNTTTSITILTIGTSPTTAFSNIPGRIYTLDLAANIPGLSNNIFHVGPSRFSLASTTTVYGLVNASFTVSTLAGWGGIRARRVR